MHLQTAPARLCGGCHASARRFFAAAVAVGILFGLTTADSARAQGMCDQGGGAGIARMGGGLGRGPAGRGIAGGGPSVGGGVMQMMQQAQQARQMQQIGQAMFRIRQHNLRRLSEFRRQQNLRQQQQHDVTGRRGSQQQTPASNARLTKREQLFQRLKERADERQRKRETHRQQRQRPQKA